MRRLHRFGGTPTKEEPPTRMPVVRIAGDQSEDADHMSEKQRKENINNHPQAQVANNPILPPPGPE